MMYVYPREGGNEEEVKRERERDSIDIPLVQQQLLLVGEDGGGGRCGGGDG